MAGHDHGGGEDERHGHDQPAPHQRRRNAHAASLGWRSRVKTPFLLPPTRMTPGVVAKPAKFHTCSPTTASNRSNTRWFIARYSTWCSSVHGVGVTACSPG